MGNTHNIVFKRPEEKRKNYARGSNVKMDIE
jgi:hypothetical protein